MRSVQFNSVSALQTTLKGPEILPWPLLRVEIVRKLMSPVPIQIPINDFLDDSINNSIRNWTNPTPPIIDHIHHI